MLYDEHFEKEDITPLDTELTVSSVSYKIKDFFSGKQLVAEKWIKQQLKKTSWENTKEEKEAISSENKKVLASILAFASCPKKINIIAFTTYNTKEEAEKATSLVVTLPNDTTFYKPYISRFVDYDPEGMCWVGELVIHWEEKALD